MNPERSTASRARGATLVEMLVGLGLLSVVGVIFSSVYRSMAGSTSRVVATADMQTLVKSMDQQIHADLARAGFGLQGIGVFTRMQAKNAQFNYRDLLGTYCKEGQLASIQYAQAGKSITRTVACDGAEIPAKATGAPRDSLDLAFRYLDNAGKVTADPNSVKTVEYTLRAFSLREHDAKQRATTGSVNLANN